FLASTTRSTSGQYLRSAFNTLASMRLRGICFPFREGAAPCILPGLCYILLGSVRYLFGPLAGFPSLPSPLLQRRTALAHAFSLLRSCRSCISGSPLVLPPRYCNFPLKPACEPLQRSHKSRRKREKVDR